MGYRYISIFQIGLTAILIISLPLWKQFQNKGNTGQPDSSSVCTLPALTLKQIFQIPGAREILFAFFCYSAIELTSSLWASSYLVLHLGYSSEKAAGFASLFFIGITVGRGISGFITFKLNDSQMIHLGEGIILIGVIPTPNAIYSFILRPFFLIPDNRYSDFTANYVEVCIILFLSIGI